MYLLAGCAPIFAGIGLVELYPLLVSQMGGGSDSASVDVKKGSLSLVLGGYCFLRAYLIRKEMQKKVAT